MSEIALKRHVGRPGRYPIIELCVSLSGTLQSPLQHLNYRVKIQIITRLKPIILIKGGY